MNHIRPINHLKKLLHTRRRRIFALIVVLIFLIPLILRGFLLTRSAEAAWYNDSWAFRKRITVDNTKVSGSSAHTDFPMLVSLNDPGLKTHAQSNGNDILFTLADGETKLSHEIESYEDGTLVAWVKIPTLSHNTDTDIYMYYGNATATNQENVTDVWDTDYKGVWHLNETSGTRTDSTTNTNTLTDNNTVTSDVGKIANSAFLDRANLEYLSRADNAGLSGGQDFTVSLWAYANSIHASGSITVAKGVSGVNADYFVYYDQGQWKLQFGNGSTPDSINKTYESPVGKWPYVVAWYDSSAGTVSIQVNDETPASKTP